MDIQNIGGAGQMRKLYRPRETIFTPDELPQDSEGVDRLRDFTSAVDLGDYSTVMTNLWQRKVDLLPYADGEKAGSAVVTYLSYDSYLSTCTTVCTRGTLRIHTHKQREIIIVTRGIMQLVICHAHEENEEHSLGPGDHHIIEPDTRHFVKFESECRFFAGTVPAKKEWAPDERDER